MKKQKKAFTLVELSVTIMIIAILASIWFYSYVWYISEARDAERTADMWILVSALQLYKQNKWWFPKPWDNFNITNEANIVAIQWKINKKVTLSTLDKLPFDPYKNQEYVYSITTNKQEAQIAMTLENWDFPTAIIDWNYQSVSVDILPTIILAMEETSDIEIYDWEWNGTINRQKFILNKWDNLPYDIDSPYEPVYWYEWLDLWTDIIWEWKVDYWQNSSYSSCTEIQDAWKDLWVWPYDYQLLNNSWELTSSGCTF